MSAVPVIGRITPIDLIEVGIQGLPAKVDTGAYRSSIWATNIYEKDGKLYFTPLGPSSPLYNGKQLSAGTFKKVKVENSFAQSEERYSIFLKIRIGGKLVRSNFTLANRSAKTYSALVGRKLLKNRFVVDVSKGNALDDEEKNGDDSLE